MRLSQSVASIVLLNVSGFWAIIGFFLKNSAAVFIMVFNHVNTRAIVYTVMHVVDIIAAVRIAFHVYPIQFVAAWCM